MNIIVSCIIPLVLLIGMNIRIYLTMKNQWSIPLLSEQSYGSKDHQQNECHQQVSFYKEIQEKLLIIHIHHG